MSANKVMWLGRLFYIGLAGLIFLMIATAGPLFLKSESANVSVLMAFGTVFVVTFLIQFFSAYDDGEEICIAHFFIWLLFAWFMGEIVFWHLLPTNSMTLSMIISVICGIISGGGLWYLETKLLISAVFKNHTKAESILIINAWFWDFIILAALPIVALVLFCTQP